MRATQGNSSVERKFACDMEVLACANGERRENRESLAPPTARTPASRTRISFGHADRCRKNRLISPLPGSSMEGGTFPDSVNTEILDESTCALGLYIKEEEEVDKGVDIIVGVFVRVERLGEIPALPPHGSRRCQPSTSCRPR